MTTASLSKMARLVMLSLFLISAPLYLLARSLTGVALQPSTYHRLIDDLHVAERLQTRVVEVGLTKTLPLTPPTPPEPPDDLPELSAATWETIADELIPTDWLNTQLHIVVDGGFDWMRGDAPLPETAVDLSVLLERLQGSRGTLALLPFLDDAPVCMPDESVNGYGVHASCLPPGANVEGVVQQTAQRLTQILPRSLRLSSLLALNLVKPEEVTQLTRLRFAAQWAGLVAGLLGNLSLLSFALYGLLTLRDWRGLITQPVRPLFSVGLVSLLLALGVGLLAQRGQLGLWLAPEAGALMREAVAYVGRATAVRLALWGGGTLLFAAVLWGLNYWLLRRKRKAVSPPRRLTRIRRQFV